MIDDGYGTPFINEHYSMIDWPKDSETPMHVETQSKHAYPYEMYNDSDYSTGKDRWYWQSQDDEGGRTEIATKLLRIDDKDMNYGVIEQVVETESKRKK